MSVESSRSRLHHPPRPAPLSTIPAPLPPSPSPSPSRSAAVPFPGFEPHPWARNGHSQTILGRYLPGPWRPLLSVVHEIAVSGGDRILAMDSRPKRWRAGDPCALLIHGLGGCCESPYVRRVAVRLHGLGVRTVRMNLRGAGPGEGLAKGIYHSGRTEDVRRTLEDLIELAPGSPIAVLGFSLGANLALKLAAEAADEPIAGWDCVLAANPPLDLAACCRNIQKPGNRVYDRNFVKQLQGHVRRLHGRFPELNRIALGDWKRARTLYDFDDLYTAPRHGFAGAEDYYAKCSSGPMIPKIALPGLVVHAEDDPFIPVEPFRRIAFPPNLRLELVPRGGHLGYLSRKPYDGDHRWLDARLVHWLRNRWTIPVPSHAEDRAS